MEVVAHEEEAEGAAVELAEGGRVLDLVAADGEDAPPALPLAVEVPELLAELMLVEEEAAGGEEGGGGEEDRKNLLPPRSSARSRPAAAATAPSRRGRGGGSAIATLSSPRTTGRTTPLPVRGESVAQGPATSSALPSTQMMVLRPPHPSSRFTPTQPLPRREVRGQILQQLLPSLTLSA